MAKDHMELSNRDIIKRLEAIELRLSRLESNTELTPTPEEDYVEIEPFEQLKKVTDGSLLESRIGESGLAWLGNIVLFIGIAFLEQFIQNLGYQIGSAIFGYVAVSGIFLLGYFLNKSYPKMASIFYLNANLLLFYVTLRLHFFSATPVLENKSIGLILLLLVVFIQLFFYVKQKSASLSGVAIILLSIVAIISDSTHIMLPLTSVIAAISVFFLYRFQWIRLLFLSIILVYLIQLIWFMNNPFMGHQLQALTAHNHGYIYLLINAAIFSLAAFFKKSDAISQDAIVGSIILNGLGFTLLLFLQVISFFKGDYLILIGSVSLYCLLYSVLLELKFKLKIRAALYALYGFVTLSIALHAIYQFPDAYFFLSIQSLLVLLMAIWFRSKFIVFMNTLLFIGLLIFYMYTATYIDSVNISFSLVALLTARILNWKRDRLTMKTDMLRNVNLIIGFVMVLITLYHLVPARYITLSWTAAAVLYFVLSLVLKNVKYRYMALGTMLAAATYLFIIDLARIELVYRIVALMFLATISIGLSIYYTIKSRKKAE